MELCVEQCPKSNSTNEKNPSDAKQIHENYSLNLICRDESSLNFQINLHTTPHNGNLKEKSDDKGNARSKETDMTTARILSSSASRATQGPTAMDFVDTEDDGGETVVFVIKMHLAEETDDFFVFLVSSIHTYIHTYDCRKC